MLNEKSLLLIHNVAQTKQGQLLQKILCAFIDGYLEGSSEYEKHITTLYRGTQEQKELAYNFRMSSEELRLKINKKYDELCNMLNKIENFDNIEKEQEEQSL
jgi:hypothetical protein